MGFKLYSFQNVWITSVDFVSSFVIGRSHRYWDTEKLMAIFVYW